MDILKQLLLGFFIGILTTTIGCYLFVTFALKTDFLAGLSNIKQDGYLGKIITLGAILNIITFFGLLKINKEIVARGVVFATIVLTIVTLFV